MQISFAQQIISLLGAVLVLVGYVGHQTKRLNPLGIFYNLVNAAGAALLLYAALRPFQIGFTIMEGAWTLVSLAALRRALLNRSQGSQL